MLPGDFRMSTTTKKDIIALFHHFIDTSDRILILTSPVTFRHNQFDIFKRFDSNLSHPQLRDVGRNTGIYKVVKGDKDLKDVWWYVNLIFIHHKIILNIHYFVKQFISIHIHNSLVIIKVKHNSFFLIRNFSSPLSIFLVIHIQKKWPRFNQNKFSKNYCSLKVSKMGQFSPKSKAIDLVFWPILTKNQSERFWSGSEKWLKWANFRPKVRL